MDGMSRRIQTKTHISKTFQSMSEGVALSKMTGIDCRRGQHIDIPSPGPMRRLYQKVEQSASRFVPCTPEELINEGYDLKFSQSLSDFKLETVNIRQDDYLGRICLFAERASY